LPDYAANEDEQIKNGHQLFISSHLDGNYDKVFKVIMML